MHFFNNVIWNEFKLVSIQKFYALPSKIYSLSHSFFSSLNKNRIETFSLVGVCTLKLGCTVSSKILACSFSFVISLLYNILELVGRLIRALLIAYVFFYFWMLIEGDKIKRVCTRLFTLFFLWLFWLLLLSYVTKSS